MQTGPRSDREPASSSLDYTSVVFKLRLENFAREDKSRVLLKGLHARQIDRQSFLFIGKPSRIIRAQPLHLDAERAFQLEEFGALLFHEERGSHAVSAVASGSPNAVDKILGYFGQIVVDDVRDVLYVNAARSEIRRHQDAEAALLEPGQSRGALRLRAVAMNHGGGEASAVQTLGNPFGSALGSRKHQALSLFLGQQALQHFLLAVHGHFKRLHAHILVWFRGRAERKTHGVVQIILYDARHIAFHRRGETHRLPLFWKNRDYALDRGKETHVQHTIRFIEDEHAQRVKVEESTVEVILKPPGSRDYEPCSLANSLQLRAFGQSAND